MRTVIVGGLLAAGCLVSLLSAIGMLVARDALNRVHFLGPASATATVLVGAAIVVQEGSTAMTEGVVLTALVVALSGPFISHIIARAAYLVERQEKPEA